MRLDPSRLRRGELIAGASAAALLALMFAVKWYGRGARVSTGWQQLVGLRWLLLVTIAAALALVVLQTALRAPAVPTTMSVLVTVLGLVTVLWLAYRVLISVPPGRKVGAFLGLVSACGIAYGGYASMRAEGISAKDEPTDIPTVPLAPDDAAQGESGS